MTAFAGASPSAAAAEAKPADMPPLDLAQQPPAASAAQTAAGSEWVSFDAGGDEVRTPLRRLSPMQQGRGQNLNAAACCAALNKPPDVPAPSRGGWCVFMAVTAAYH